MARPRGKSPSLVTPYTKRKFVQEMESFLALSGCSRRELSVRAGFGAACVSHILTEQNPGLRRKTITALRRAMRSYPWDGPYPTPMKSMPIVIAPPASTNDLQENALRRPPWFVRLGRWLCQLDRGGTVAVDTGGGNG
jgi:hypothetical protein